MYTMSKYMLNFSSVEMTDRLTDATTVGNGYQVFHTPGHCPGEICLLGKGLDGEPRFTHHEGASGNQPGDGEKTDGESDDRGRPKRDPQVVKRESRADHGNQGCRGERPEGGVKRAKRLEQELGAQLQPFELTDPNLVFGASSLQ